MESPSLMEVLGLDSISGHALVLSEMPLLPSNHIPPVAAAVVTTSHTQHLLLGMITSVILVVMPLAILTSFSLVTHCGMVLGVVPPAPAAHSTTLHGSTRSSPSPPLMTWRSGSVIALHVGTHLSSSWRSLCNKCTCTINYVMQVKVNFSELLNLSLLS